MFFQEDSTMICILIIQSGKKPGHRKIKAVCQSQKASKCQSLDSDTRDWSSEPAIGANLPYPLNHAIKYENILICMF